ncbi:MAG: GNAT family N-acetyltransferase [Candidatus Hermodarchaeota archaeon]|nr:GNAT family N-acetyltransferase [Candidatus Hermodarchaeota archaeon]
MRKVREFTPADAEELAQCINESEGGWPGGLTQGVQHTVQHVMEDYEREVKFSWLIAVDEHDQVAGISTLHPHYEDQEAAYLGFLNVADAFRKKGFGKALLIESVERTRELGYKRLFLGTWAGNLNAVPVYKRTGFFWRPDTQVEMDNYIPMILEMPIAQSFFQKHNWYDSYVRRIEIVPDEMEYRGLHVYEYRWQEESDSLRIVIDRESRGPTVIESDEVLVECWVADPEPTLGLPIPVEWTIRNKVASKSLQCQLRAKLPKGFQMIEAPPSKITVQPNDTITIKGVIQGKVTVTPPIEEKAALSIKSKLQLEKIPVELETGLRVKHPIEISTVPPSLWCRPGNELNLDITLKSNLKMPAQGTLRLRLPRGLKVPQKQFEVNFTPEGYSGISVKALTDSGLKTIALPIRMHLDLLVEGQQLRTRTETINVHCLDKGGVLVTSFDDKRRLQVHTDTLHFTINLMKGAHIDRLNNKITRREHLRSHCRESIGPPFWPSEQMRAQFNYEIDYEKNGTTNIRTWMESQRYPGVTFTKTYKIFGSSDILRIDYQFENKHPTNTYDFRLQVSSLPGVWDHLHILPLKNGLLRAEFIEDEFFASPREVPKKREEWAETWYCAERPHKGEITAVLCHPAIFHEARGVTLIDFLLKPPPLPPNTHVDLPPFYLVSGVGTWQHVRQLWYQFYSPHPEAKMPEFPVFDYLDVRLIDHPPLYDALPKIIVPLQVQHLVHRPLQGRLRLSTSKGWKVTPRTKKFKDLTRDSPLTFPIELSSTSTKFVEPGILSIQVKVETPLTDYHFSLPIILHRKPGSVSISTIQEQDHKITIIDNGAYQLKVAPDFAGSVIALINKITGTNYLKSSFPKAGPMAWFNPWYGGIRFEPFSPKQPGWFPTKLDQEPWSLETIQRREWEGVSISSTPDKQAPKLRGYQLELQVLTQPFSNIFALIGRVTNLTKALRIIRHRIKVALPPEGSPTGLRTVIPRATMTYHRRQGESHAWPTTTQYYFGVEHMKDDATLLFIKKQGPMGELYEGILGQDVIQILNEDYLRVSPDSASEQTSFLVISKEPWEQAKDYAILSELTL